jgi:replicative DNA helicase
MLFYPTGFEDLDTLIGGGFATRQMCGIIGPPSAGKSALVGHWLLGLSTQRPVLHCSTELPRHELFVRYAAHKMQFPWRDGMKGKVAQSDMAAAVKGTRIRLLGCDDLDRNDPMGSIEIEMDRMAQECGIAPIGAVDYIQMMARGAATEMRHKVGELTMRARVMSQHFDTVMLGVFSTGRANYGGKFVEAMRAANDPTAYLGAAKESGDIEFDCATLMYLDVDKLHEGNPKPGRIAVARCRVGDVGFVGVRAQLDIGKFWCDPTASGELASDERKARREADDLDNACKRLLEVITKMPNRPWKEMQSATKLNYALLNTARSKLMEDGIIEQIDRRGWDEHKQKLRGTTLVIRQIVPDKKEDV